MERVTMKTKVVLWDLDSTIANTTHRQHMIPAIKEHAKGGPTWEDYSMACVDDTPVEGTVALVRLLDFLSSPAIPFWQYGVSGRSESARGRTLEWFDKHGVPLDGLHLRPDGDHTPNGKYKVGVINKLRDSGKDVLLFVEDWKETGEYIREKTGVPVLLVQGDYAVGGQNL
jgi:hypothetical protein